VYCVYISDRGPKQVDVLGLGTFVKYGSEILMGYPPKRLAAIMQRSGAPISSNAHENALNWPIKLFATKLVSDELRSLVKESYSNFCAHLLSVHKEMRSKEVNSVSAQ
jgi:hypothetical protein